MFKTRLKELRTEQKLSQSQLAELIQSTQQQVSKWEHGIIEPNIKMIGRLREAFNVSSDYLLGFGESSESPKD